MNISRCYMHTWKTLLKINMAKLNPYYQILFVNNKLTKCEETKNSRLIISQLICNSIQTLLLFNSPENAKYRGNIDWRFPYMKISCLMISFGVYQRKRRLYANLEWTISLLWERNHLFDVKPCVELFCLRWFFTPFSFSVRARACHPKGGLKYEVMVKFELQ